VENYKYIIDFYNNVDEDSRLTDTKHGQVEFLTTMRYIEKYLTSGAKILEIGAGTGRYSHALALKGYDVTAVELVEYNINIFKNRLLIQPVENEKINIIQGNALDLSGFDNRSFDITLVLGPIYHLYCVEDKIKALSEAIRVTKKGGVIFVAYCISDSSIITGGFKNGNIIDWINDRILDGETFRWKMQKDVFDRCVKEDIDGFMDKFDNIVERLHYVATDGQTNYMRETVDNMTDEMFEVYLKYHFTVCERDDLVGATHHSLDVLRKL